MKKLSGSLFLKMLSFVIVCIAAPMLGINIFCAFEAYDAGIYQRAVTFNESNICRNFVKENLAEVREYMYWNDLSGLKERTYYNEHENFAYTIYDENKNIVYSTIHKDKKYDLVVKDYPAREVDEEGDVDIRTVDIPYQARLIDAGDYDIGSYEFLKGLICGVHAGNYDITHFFVDNFYKLVNDQSMEALEVFITWLAKFAEAEKIEFVISISADAATVPESVKQYII